LDSLPTLAPLHLDPILLSLKSLSIPALKARIIAVNGMVYRFITLPRLKM
jgi:hypothetical protein